MNLNKLLHDYLLVLLQPNTLSNEEHTNSEAQQNSSDEERPKGDGT